MDHAVSQWCGLSIDTNDTLRLAWNHQLRLEEERVRIEFIMEVIFVLCQAGNIRIWSKQRTKLLPQLS